MAVRIRFRPTKTNQSIVVTDSRKSVKGSYLEKIGYYTKHSDRFEYRKLSINIHRLMYWLSQGAKPTDSVLRLLNKSCIIQPELFNRLK